MALGHFVACYCVCRVKVIQSLIKQFYNSFLYCVETIAGSRLYNTSLSLQVGGACRVVAVFQFAYSLERNYLIMKPNNWHNIIFMSYFKRVLLFIVCV